MRRAIESGFGLVELMVSLLVVSVVMLGAYQYSIKVTRKTIGQERMAQLSGEAAKLQSALRGIIRNIGYNPAVRVYDVTDASEDQKVGVTLIEPSHLKFTADDDRVEGCDPIAYTPCAEGAIAPSEKYEIWVEDQGGIAQNFGGLVSQVETGTGCTPASAPFGQTYRLMGKMKDPQRFPGNPTAATKDVVLSENAACLEIRYFNLPETGPPVRLWAGASDLDYRPPTNFYDVIHDNVTNEDQIAGFRFIRDMVHRIEIYVLLAGPVDPETAPIDPVTGQPKINPLTGKAQDTILVQVQATLRNMPHVFTTASIKQGL